MDPSILKTVDDYTPLSPVRLFMVPGQVGQLIFHVRYGKEPREVSTVGALLSDYRYFRIFAWADHIDFNLDCVVEESSSFSFGDMDVAPPQLTKTFWVLKIRDETWDVHTFKVGQQTWFTTHTLQSERRPEYEQFHAVQPGDQIVAYAMAPYNAAVCLMEVTQGIHTDLGKGEVIAMVIREILSPAVPLNSFSSSVSIADKLSESVPARLIRITEEDHRLMTANPSGNRSQMFLPSFTAEGNHRTTKDQLDFSDDIDSFARAICLKSVKPPLAIGLFGNWGSGKSYFMENLIVRIEQLKGSHSRYVEQAVQVKFNSWHYSDANLWASLITELFDELFRFSKSQGKTEEVNKLSEKLQIAIFQKEAAEAKRKALEEKQAQLEREQARKRARLEDLTGLGLLKLIVKDPKVQQDLKSFDNEHVEQIFKDKEKVDFFLDQTSQIGNKVRYFISELSRMRGRWMLVILLALLVASVPWSLVHFDLLAKAWQLLTAKIAVYLAPAVIVFTNAGKTLQAINKQFETARNCFKSLQQTFESRPKEETNELRNNREELESTRTSLENINIEIGQITTELSDFKSGRKLLKFIEERSREEQYTAQLGLISLIRKDFKKLDALLRGQGEALTDPGKKYADSGEVRLRIDRIILYIDDLDRCGEEVVVRVLQAVNLLLAFELFVVVVGVDPRWLSQSLNKKYSFFADKSVSPYEYLEKIFQIPFTLRAADQKGREDLLAYLFRDEIQSYNASDQVLKESQPVVGADGQTNSREEIPSVNIGTAPNVPPESAGPEPTSSASEKEFSINNSELFYIRRISGIFGHTPRTIKRFVNIYRLIKTHRRFVAALDPRPTLLLLSVVVGYPDLTSLFFAPLISGAQDSLSALLSANKALRPLEDAFRKHLAEEDWAAISVEELKLNFELVSRFTFRALQIHPGR
jgi:hypothetical protein